LLGSLYFIANVNIWPTFWWLIVFCVSALDAFGLSMLIVARILWNGGLLVIIKWRLDIGARQNFEYSPIFREGASDWERYKTAIRFLVENNFDVAERPPVQNESKDQKGGLTN
jgi:hypothetical protein